MEFQEVPSKANEKLNFKLNAILCTNFGNDLNQKISTQNLKNVGLKEFYVNFFKVFKRKIYFNAISSLHFLFCLYVL